MSVAALVVSKHVLNHRPLHRWLADLVATIPEIPHLRAAVGCCGDYFVIGERTAFLVASERARWLRIR